MNRLKLLGLPKNSILFLSRRVSGHSWTSPVVGSQFDIVRGREAISPFVRAISHLSTRYEANLGIARRAHGLLRLKRVLLSQSFHATGPCHAIEKDYYETLGIPKDASIDDIKKAFHALAKKYHPDANKNNPASKRKFQEIRDAYEILRDPKKRAHYDKKFSRGPERVRYTADNTDEFHEGYRDPFSEFQQSNHGPFSSSFYRIFSEVFENERKTYAADVEVELNLSFAEAAKDGRGHPANAEPVRCPTCNGVGRVSLFPFTSTCRSCKGSGKIIKDYCTTCRGSGFIDGVKNVVVTIPAGVDSGDTIRVPNAGNQGGWGAHPGDLNIKLKVGKDSVFTRDGADVYVDTHISFTQAILGGKVEVPTLAGKMELKIPKGVQPGQLLVLRGRGLPKQVGLVDHGDQYVRFRVHFPSSVTVRQRELLEEFAKEEVKQESYVFANGNWWRQVANWASDPRFMLGIAFLLLLNLLVSKSLS